MESRVYEREGDIREGKVLERGTYQRGKNIIEGGLIRKRKVLERWLFPEGGILESRVY